MKSINHIQLGVVLIALIAALAFPNTGFAVDPDMQALVIDNGSGMCADMPGSCDAEWNKLWNKLDRADRNLIKIGNVKPDKKNTAMKIGKLCDRTSEMIVDLMLETGDVENCCGGVNDEFRDALEDLHDDFLDACD